MPGFLPFSGSLGSRFPTFSVRDGTPDLRYYAKLKTATRPLTGRFASRSLPVTLCFFLSLCPVSGSLTGGSPSERQVLCSAGSPGYPAFPHKETDGSPKFPSYPYEDMPRSQTPVVSQTHHPIPSGTAAFHPLQGVGFPPSCKSDYPNGPRLYRFRGSIKRPAFSLPPASYTPLLESHAASLLTGWLGFGQVGLEPYRPSPTG